MVAPNYLHRLLLQREKRHVNPKCDVPEVVVWVDAHVVLLGVEGELAFVQLRPQLVLMQVRPPPYPSVDNVGKTFPSRHLQATVKGTWDRNTPADDVIKTVSNIQQIIMMSQLLTLRDEIRCW